MEQKYLQAAGRFDVEVVQPENGWIAESKEKQTPYVRIPYVVIEDGPHKGCIGIWKGWLSPAAFDMTIRTLAKAFNFDGNLPALHTGKVTFAGLKANVTTEITTVGDKRRCETKWLNEFGAVVPKMDEAKVASILSQFGDRAKAIAKEALKEKGAPSTPSKRASAPKPQDPVNEPPSPPEDDSDVPF